MEIYTLTEYTYKCKLNLYIITLDRILLKRTDLK